jgi:hypothetical protein
MERLEDRQLLSGVTNLTPSAPPSQVVLPQLTQLVTGQAPAPSPLPDTAVTAVSLIGKGPAFNVSFQGTDAGGNGIASFQVYVSVDNAAATKIATVPAGTPFKTVFSGATTYQAIADGKSHQYRFYSCGVDTSGGIQSTPPVGTDDASVTAQFAAPGALAIQSFVVQEGAKERSFVRYIDVTFNQSVGLSALVASVNAGIPADARIRLVRYSLNGAGPAVPVSLQMKVKAVGDVLAFDFGSGGIGGNANSSAGDGYYALQFDLDGNGTFETVKHFYRLLGDVNGDRSVDSVDYALVFSTLFTASSGVVTPGGAQPVQVLDPPNPPLPSSTPWAQQPTSTISKVSAGTILNEDANGDGVVNAQDVQLVLQGMGHQLARWLVIDG